MRSDKRKLVKEFRKDACGGDKKRATIRLEKYYAVQNKRDESSVDTDDLYDAPDLQESILEEIYNVDQEIVAQEHSLKFTRNHCHRRRKRCKYHDLQNLDNNLRNYIFLYFIL